MALNDNNQQATVFVGTYTRRESFVDGHGKGIYSFRMDLSTGALHFLDVFDSGINPSFLALSPAGHHLYAVNEINPPVGDSGMVSAFAIDPATRRLTFLNRVSTHGFAPCHISLDQTGRYALVANYHSGSVCSFPILKDGSLGEATAVVQLYGSGPYPLRQAGPHAHMIAPSPDGRFFLVTDLGTDEFLVYELDQENGALQRAVDEPVKLPAAAGPRHFSFHPSGRFVFVNGELDASVTVFEFHQQTGDMRFLQHLSTLPDHFSSPSSGAEIQVHPSGKFLYASNRGHNSLAIFTIDGDRGELAPVGWVDTLGNSPRNFTFDPTGNFLLVGNQDSDQIMTFQVDLETGDLRFVERTITPTPVCILCLEGW